MIILGCEWCVGKDYYFIWYYRLKEGKLWLQAWRSWKTISGTTRFTREIIHNI